MSLGEWLGFFHADKQDSELWAQPTAGTCAVAANWTRLLRRECH